MDELMRNAQAHPVKPGAAFNTPLQSAGVPTAQWNASPSHAPGARRRKGRPGRRRRRGVFLPTLFSAVIGAITAMLLLPLAFGVSSSDLIGGRLRNAESAAVEEAGSAKVSVNVVSPADGGMSVAEIAEKVVPSIVNIDVRTAPQRTPFFTMEAQEGTGSGVIYSSDGYIITNSHVVSGAREITVTLASGESVTGRLVGADPATDIAVVKVDRSGLPAISTSDSEKLTVGELCVAVGSSFGFEQTVTSGIISALDRTVSAGSTSGGQASTLNGLIQTDAAINPGNSGGALCDGTARLIGVNAVIATSSGGSEGVGFAIPANTVREIADALIEGVPVQG